MRTRWTAPLVACLVLALGAAEAAAQEPRDQEPRKDMLDDVAGIHQTLVRLVDLLETIRDNQKVDLLLKRIELKERRLAPLESRLRSSESWQEGIQEEIDGMETMRARLEDEVAEEVRTGRDEVTRETRQRLEDVEMTLEMLNARLERALAQAREHEDALADERKEIKILDELLEGFLE